MSIEIILSLIGIVLLLVATVYGVWWRCREKVEIKYPNMLATLKTERNAGIKIEYSFALLYTKGTRDYHVSQIWSELDKQLWERLFPYFEVPLRITFNQDELPKLEPGKPKWLGFDWWCPVRKGITKQELQELDGIVQKLWYHYKIGWKDTYGKTRWKTINQLRELQKREVM